MTFWIPDNIRQATGGTWLVRPGQIELPKDRPADLPLPNLYAPILGVSTDSRTIQQGQMYIALKGERFDGHAFAADAARAGAPIIVISDARSVPPDGFDFAPDVGILKVDDTGKALLKIAQAYRKSLARTKVIAVCGSNGKTTTTRLIEHLLSQTMRGTASRKSFNNNIGVPLTILSAKENDQYLICEVGTNAPGEIAELGAVVQPDIAVITSIGREHLEKLGDIAGVAKEEAAILDFVRGTGCAVVTADAPELEEFLKRVKTVITFGRAKTAMLRLVRAWHEMDSAGRLRLAFETNGRQEGRLSLVGEHNALNALAALGVSRRLGINEAKALAALATAGGADMRLERTVVHGRVLLNDAYNANPDSMIAGIDTMLSLRDAGLCNEAPDARTVLVLGEMLELGAASTAGHMAVAQHLIDRLSQGKKIDLVVLVGAGMKTAHEALMRAGWTRDRLAHLDSTDGENAADIAQMFDKGDVILLKGSRRVKLERVAQALKDQPEDEACSTTSTLTA
jgi:UDP-N-acetylmuramoyl-tripeptide--D-alanyl-D-alanine ligase